MGQPDASTSAPGSDNPQEKRTCTTCKAEKVVTPETWVYRKGRTGTYQAHGARCLDCEKTRKAKYEETRNDIARKLAAPAASAKDKAADGKTDGKRGKDRLEVEQALKAGGIALNLVAPSVMARMMGYLDDEESPHHVWALEFFAQRILPRKLYEELGGQAAGVGALNDKRPQFIVNVLPASPGGAQSGVTYENGETALLPSPEEANPSDAG